MPQRVICSSDWRNLALRECVELAEKYDRNLLATKEDTSTFMADLISMLRNAMAPRVTLHGVLVETTLHVLFRH